MTPTLQLENGRLSIRGTGSSPEEQAAVARIPSIRWSRKDKVWSYSATPIVVAQVVRAFPSIVLDSGARALLDRWEKVKLARRQLDDKVPFDEPIPGELIPLREHQLLAIRWARDAGSVYLEHDMGTGKTATTIGLASILGARRTLVACPNMVVDVWPAQIRKHSTLPFRVAACGPDVDGTAKKVKLAQQTVEEGDRLVQPVFVVVNHEAVWRTAFAKWASRVPWDLLVIDEAHKTKTPSGKLSGFLKDFAPGIPWKVALSGTPTPKDPLDLYAQLRWLEPGVFGTNFEAFKRRFAEFGGYGGYEVTEWKNQEEFSRKWGFIRHKVRTSEVLELPPMEHVVVPVALGNDERRIYRDLEREFVADIEAGTITVANVLTRALRLSQVVNGHVGIDTDDPKNRRVETVGHSKERALEDLLDGAPRDEPIVVFTRFVHDVEAVRRVAAMLEREVYEVSGREKTLAGWKSAAAAGRGPIIAVNIQSGKEGIDLTEAARYVVYFSLGYSLGDYEQSLKRTHRDGQTRPVTYYYLVGKGTIDERIAAALREKKSVVEMMLEGRRAA